MPNTLTFVSALKHRIACALQSGCLWDKGLEVPSSSHWTDQTVVYLKGFSVFDG